MTKFYLALCVLLLANNVDGLSLQQRWGQLFRTETVSSDSAKVQGLPTDPAEVLRSLSHNRARRVGSRAGAETAVEKHDRLLVREKCKKDTVDGSGDVTGNNVDDDSVMGGMGMMNGSNFNDDVDEDFDSDTDGKGKSGMMHGEGRSSGVGEDLIFDMGGKGKGGKGMMEMMSGKGKDGKGMMGMMSGKGKGGKGGMGMMSGKGMRRSLRTGVKDDNDTDDYGVVEQGNADPTESPKLPVDESDPTGTPTISPTDSPDCDTTEPPSEESSVTTSPPTVAPINVDEEDVLCEEDIFEEEGGATPTSVPSTTATVPPTKSPSAEPTIEPTIAPTVTQTVSPVNPDIPLFEEEGGATPSSVPSTTATVPPTKPPSN